MILSIINCDGDLFSRLPLSNVMGLLQRIPSQLPLKGTDFL
jgi:hypothetical protein